MDDDEQDPRLGDEKMHGFMMSAEKIRQFMQLPDNRVHAFSTVMRNFVKKSLDGNFNPEVDGAAQRLKEAKLADIIPNYRTHDFRDYLINEEFLLIQTIHIDHFLLNHDHMHLLLERMHSDFRTHVVTVGNHAKRKAIELSDRFALLNPRVSREDGRFGKSFYAGGLINRETYPDFLLFSPTVRVVGHESVLGRFALVFGTPPATTPAGRNMPL